MRDLTKYAEDYTQQPFDNTHLQFRRIQLMEQINKYKHNNILEISCGVRPLFEDYTGFKKLIIVEPTHYFIENAKALHQKKPELDLKVEFINDYFENASEQLIDADLDFIILSNVLQEIEDPAYFVNQL